MSSPIQRKLYALRRSSYWYASPCEVSAYAIPRIPKGRWSLRNCANKQLSPGGQGRVDERRFWNQQSNAITYPLPTLGLLNKIPLASSTLDKGGRRKLWKKKEKKGLSSPKLRLQFTGRKKSTTTRHRSLLVRPMPLIRISSSALMRRISLNASRSMLICSPGMSIGIRRLIPATPLSGSGLSAES